MDVFEVPNPTSLKTMLRKRICHRISLDMVENWLDFHNSEP